ncbi:hypothetical protein NIES4106_03060 [Fischerella sp. NIES-4106]|jgi:hypothetical protein|nr:hypothetical protein NIES4106_03060 [Fischerella sp. NIES-4106]
MNLQKSASPVNREGGRQSKSSLIKAAIALPAVDCLPTFSLFKVRSRACSNSSRLALSVVRLLIFPGDHLTSCLVLLLSSPLSRC